MTNYTITISYPDGHLEELEEIFVKLEKAIEYGKRYLIQVYGNESFKRGASGEAYFTVVEHSESGGKIVYDSKESKL